MAAFVASKAKKSGRERINSTREKAKATPLRVPAFSLSRNRRITAPPEERRRAATGWEFQRGS